MITASDVKTRFPGVFDSLDDSFLEILIAEAALLISESLWGDHYNIGLLYLTAHLASTTAGGSSGSPGAIGPITSRRVGDVAVTYASPASSPSNENYTSTTYGQMYLSLRRIYQSGPVTTGYGIEESGLS
jgi:hypothetical protein